MVFLNWLTWEGWLARWCAAFFSSIVDFLVVVVMDLRRMGKKRGRLGEFRRGEAASKNLSFRFSFIVLWWIAFIYEFWPFEYMLCRRR